MREAIHESIRQAREALARAEESIRLARETLERVRVPVFPSPVVTGWDMAKPGSEETAVYLRGSDRLAAICPCGTVIPGERTRCVKCEVTP